MPLYDFVNKVKTGEYISEFNGYSSQFIGNFYGEHIKLGGQAQFGILAGFHTGICDVEWWIKDKLDNLSEYDKNNLLDILKRNKLLNDFVDEHTPKLAELLCVKPYEIFRLGVKKIIILMDTIYKLQNDDSLYKFILDNDIKHYEKISQSLQQNVLSYSNSLNDKYKQEQNTMVYFDDLDYAKTFNTDNDITD